MEFSIDQSAFIKALERGGLASSTPSTNFESNCIKLKAYDDMVSISSYAGYVASFVQLDDVEIKKEGEVILNYEAILDWCKIQKNSTLLFKFTASKNKKTVKLQNSGDAETDDAESIDIVGKLHVKAKDEEGALDKWSTKAYELPKSYTPDTGTEMFSVSSEAFKCAVKHISPCTIADVKHFLDAVAFQYIDGELHAICTDKIRCSTFKFSDVNFAHTSFKNGVKKDDSLVFPMIIVGLDFIKKTLKFINDDSSISLHFESKGYCALRVENGNNIFWHKIKTHRLKEAKEFPKVSPLLSMKKKKICTVSRSSFVKRLSSAKLINSRCILLIGDANEGEVRVHSVSDFGKDDNTGVLSAEIDEDFRIMVSPSHLIDFMTVSQADKITISLSEQGATVYCLQDLELNDEWLYFSMKTQNAKYDGIS